MKFTLAAAAALVGAVAAQGTIPAGAGPTSTVSAQGMAPSGCSLNYPQVFQIAVSNATAPSSKKMLRRELSKRQMTDGTGNSLYVAVKNGILISTTGATGYVAGGNHQFQFTKPEQNGQPQPGFDYDAGFSVCANGTIAHGGTTVFYECAGGERNTVEDANTGANCYPIYLSVYVAGGSAPASTSTVTKATGAPGTASVPVGATTATPLTTIADGQPGAASTGVVKTTSAAIVTVISDNQPQVGTKSAVKTTSPVAVLTVISDNQPQAPTPARTPYKSAATTPAQFTGAAAVNYVNAGVFAGAAAVAAAML